MEHYITIDETEDGSAFQAFCECGWSEEQPHRATDQVSWPIDKQAARDVADAAATDAADEHMDEARETERENASRIATIEGFITLADGTRSNFVLTSDGGWQQWGASSERLGQTVDALDALIEGLREGDVRFEGED